MGFSHRGGREHYWNAHNTKKVLKTREPVPFATLHAMYRVMSELAKIGVTTDARPEWLFITVNSIEETNMR
jgi:hypothetical protein